MTYSIIIFLVVGFGRHVEEISALNNQVKLLICCLMRIRHTIALLHCVNKQVKLHVALMCRSVVPVHRCDAIIGKFSGL
jgi:hypothetical protein